MKDGVEISYAAAGRSLPISFSSSGPQEHSWHYNNDITALTLVTCARGSNCSEAPFHNRRPLPLPKHPLLAEVTAASSASLGFAGSPSVYGTIADIFVNSVTKGTAGKLLKPFWKLIVDCWPYGSEALASPIIAQGRSAQQAEDAPVPYRFMDGGYAENTALAMTIAAAQRDCAAGRLDCSEPIDAILVNDGNHSAQHNGFGPFSAKDPFRALFADTAAPVGSWVPGMFGSVKVPSQTIFAEAAPAPSGWTPYIDFPSLRVEGLFKKVPINITSYSYTSTLTTVENPYLGVRGGQKVRLLALSLDVPGIIFPGLFDPEQAQLVSPGHMRECDGAVNEDRDLIAGHAPLTKAQAIALAPVLKEFFASRSTRSLAEPLR